MVASGFCEVVTKRCITKFKMGIQTLEFYIHTLCASKLFISVSDFIIHYENPFNE